MTIHLTNHVELSTSDLLPKLIRGLVAEYDRLTGPAMSEQERVNHRLHETSTIRDISTMVI